MPPTTQPRVFVDDGFPGAREFENNYKPLRQVEPSVASVEVTLWQRVAEACRSLPSLRERSARVAAFSVQSLKRP